MTHDATPDGPSKDVTGVDGNGDGSFGDVFVDGLAETAAEGSTSDVAVDGPSGDGSVKDATGQ